MSALGRLKRVNAAEDFVFRLRMKVFDERIALARENRATEFKAVNGLGVIQARIGQYEYFLAKIEYGWNCWADPDFLPAYIRDNPEIRVDTSRGTRGQEYAGTRGLAVPALPLVLPPSYADTPTDTHPDPKTHSNTDPEANAHGDPAADPDTNRDPKPDTYPYPNSPANSDPDGNSDCDPNADAIAAANSNTFSHTFGNS